ncbi:hypothetical protein Tco_1025725 [Tanacetum coccineum]
MNERRMRPKEENNDFEYSIGFSLELFQNSSGTKSEKHDTSSRSGNDTHAEDANIKPINKLKAQLQAKTTLISNLKTQIKNVHETSNEAKVKNDIDVIETINIELEHSVAKLLTENEQLHKENKHLKQTYKELYDLVKKICVQNKDINNSLIAQINHKKLKGNSVDTKFSKASILEKPPLQPSRNHLVIRKSNAFKSEQPRISKPRFASQVDEKNDFSKTITPYYLPKVRESAFINPHHVIAPNSSRNSQKESCGSNDMAHNYFLEDARKKTQARNMNSKPSVTHSTSLQNTTNGSKPKPRSNNPTSRSLNVSKSSYVTSSVVPLVDHSRKSSSFSDSKHFVCSTLAGDGVVGIKRRRRDLCGDGVRNSATASRRGRLKEDLESSTWRWCQEF